ncbi:MAG: dephospho-CoA kinase [Verrucomicrobiales bacterium]|nr:dephospho-CoA kinase [Verrucomicrobiales bacterium]
MINVAITGGIAMGKSSFLKELRLLLEGVEIFDADECVGELLTTEVICEKIVKEFGSAVLDNNETIDRSYLRHQVFDSVDRRAALEDILHPEVYQRYLDASRVALAESAKIFLADIPLFFETGSKYTGDVVAVVACDENTQLSRLAGRSGVKSSLARQMINAQLPIKDKMALADHVIWNAGSPKQLKIQTIYFAKWLNEKI